jgi:hypothetical protein
MQIFATTEEVVGWVARYLPHPIDAELLARDIDEFRHAYDERHPNLLQAEAG